MVLFRKDSKPETWNSRWRSGEQAGRINPRPEDPICRSGLDCGQVRISWGAGMVTDLTSLRGFAHGLRE